MPQNSFPRWLIASAVLVLLILLAAGTWFYDAQQHHMRNQAEAELQAIAQLKVNQIVAWRTEQLTDASVLTQTPFFIDGAKRWLADDAVEQREEILATFRTWQDYYHYYDVLLVDVDGRVRLSLKGNLDQLHAETAQAVADAWTTRRPVMSDLHAGPGGLPTHLGVVAPLFDGAEPTAEPIGAVVIQHDTAQFLYPLIQSWPTLSDSAETLIVRQDGDSVLFLNELRHQPGTALTLRAPLTQKDLPAAMAVLGREGIVQGIDYRGVEVLAMVQAIPDSPWFMVAKVDTDEVFANWRTRSMLIIGLFLGFAAIAATVTLGYWQRAQKDHFRILLRAEKARHESEARYHTTLLSIGDGVIVTDAQGAVRLLNPVAEALTGWTQAETYGKPLEDVFHVINEETQSLIENPIRRVMHEGIVVGLTNHTLLISKDGRAIPIADSGAPIRAADGQLLGTVLVFRDQTEDRAGRKALQEREEKYRLLFENMAAAFALHEMMYDDQGHPMDYRFLEVNPVFEKLTGLSAENLIGRTVKEVLPNTEPYWIEVYGNVALTGEPVAYQNYSQEIGRHFDVWAFRPSPGQFATVFTDITDRVHSEETLRRQHQYLLLLQETTLDLVSQLDLDHLLENIVRRAADLVGTSAGFLDLIDPDTGQLVPTIGLGALAESLKFAVEPGQGLAGLVWQTRQPLVVNDYDNWPERTEGFANNLIRSIIGVPLLSGSQVLGVLGLAYEATADTAFGPETVDMLEQFARLATVAIENARLFTRVEQELDDRTRAEAEIQKLNAELEQRVADRTAELTVVNQELEAFAYSVSHDLRAPLRALDGFSAALLSHHREQLDKQGQHYLDRIQAASQRMGQLINDLLALSRVTRREMNHQRVDLSALARKIAAELRASNTQRPIDFVIADNLVVHGDAPLLRIALENLMNNAWKFSEPRPQAHIEVGVTTQPGGPPVYFVRDDGVGFDMTYADKLFAPFQRLHGMHEFPGTGIGLVTVKRIITRHGGHLWTDAAVDQGATFYFTLGETP